MQPTSAPGQTYDYRRLTNLTASLDLELGGSSPTLAARWNDVLLMAQHSTLLVVRPGADSPTLLQRVSWARPIVGVAADGDAVFIRDATHLHVLDARESLTTPHTSIEISTSWTPGTLHFDRELFVGSRNDVGTTIRVYDVSNPTSLVQLAALQVSGGVVSVAREGSRLVTGSIEGATCFDISNYGNVQQLWTIPNARFVAASGGRVFASGTLETPHTGLREYRLGESGELSLIRSDSRQRDVGQLSVKNEQLLIRKRDRVEIIRFDQEGSWEEPISLRAPGLGWVDLEEDQLWVAGSVLRIFRMGQDLELSVLNQVATRVLWGIGSDDDRVYFYGDGIYSIDTRDDGLRLTQVGERARLSPEAIRGNWLLERSLNTIEVYDRSGLRQVGSFDLTPHLQSEHDRIERIAIENNRVLVTTRSQSVHRYGVTVLQLEPDGRLHYSGQLFRSGDPEARLEAIASKGQLIVVALRTGPDTGVLEVLELAGARTPRLVSSLAIPPPNRAMWLHDEELYLSTATGLLGVDLRDPIEPRLRGFVSSVRNAESLVVSRGHLYAMSSQETAVLSLLGQGRLRREATLVQRGSARSVGLFAGRGHLIALFTDRVEVLPLHQEAQ